MPSESALNATFKQGRTELIQGRKAVNWLKPHWLKLPLGFEHSLASFVRWTGRCCLYPLRGSYYKVFNEAWHNPINSTAWSSDLEPYGGYRCIAWTLGLHWHSSLRHPRLIWEELYTLPRILAVSQRWPRDKQNRSSHGRYTALRCPYHSMRGDRDVDRFPCPSTYPPSYYGIYPPLGFSHLDTLVDYLLHQMHLMHSDVLQPYPRTGPFLSTTRLVECL